MDVTDVKPPQKLGLVLADFSAWQFCYIVDKDQERSRVGYKCPVCKYPSPAGRSHFNISTYSLINLTQEAFHSKSGLYEDREGSRTDAHNISVLLFFCALREVVLNHFVSKLCVAQGKSLEEHDKLLKNNKSYDRKRKKLLPSLVGCKWNELVGKVNNLVEFDCLELNDFLKNVSDKRNLFVHVGPGNLIDRALAEECIRHISPLLYFYVTLHNEYVHPYYFSQGQKP